MADDADADADRVTYTVEISRGQTVVDVVGERDAAVIVESASGERIYLPPPNFDDPPTADRTTPYESPYSGAGDGATAYATAYDASGADARTPGLQPTADGFRIVHPEPVTDVRLLRGHSESASR